MNAIRFCRRAARRGVCAAAIGSALAVSSGCQSVGALSTAASMLVEVDVYKGPLGSRKSVQLGELVAIFDQADGLLRIFMRQANEFGHCACDTAKPGTAEDTYDRQQLCDARASAGRILDKMAALPRILEGTETRGVDATVEEQKSCRDPLNAPRARWDAALLKLAEAAATLEAAASADASARPDPKKLMKDKELVNRAATEASRLATQLKVEAFYWSESQVGRITYDPRLRALLVGYVNLTSELANQISARTVAIDKQLDRNVSGSTLALSDHLKDTGPTDFLHLFDWYEATRPDPLQDKLSAPDRARLARRLFSDHYWTRINQVHASGQGDVRMALIKDDIGNWNLKSFDNDAEKLLKAYRQLTLAGIDAGVRVARTIGTGSAAASLDLASQFARGRLGSAETANLNSQRIDAMRAGLVARLEQIRIDAQAADSRLQGTEDRDEREEAMAVALENARTELEVHRRVIDSLREFQVTAPTTTPTTRKLSNLMQP